MAEHRAARYLDLGCFQLAAKPGVHARRRSRRDPHHLGIHGVVLLRVSRRGDRARRLPLMRLHGVWPARLAWFCIIWITAVGFLAAVALAVRVALSAAGMKS